MNYLLAFWIPGVLVGYCLQLHAIYNFFIFYYKGNIMMFCFPPNRAGGGGGGGGSHNDVVGKCFCLLTFCNFFLLSRGQLSTTGTL